MPGAIPGAEALGAEGVAGCDRRFPRVTGGCPRGGRGAPATLLPPGAFSPYRPMVNPGMRVLQVESETWPGAGGGGGQGEEKCRSERLSLTIQTRCRCISPLTLVGKHPNSSNAAWDPINASEETGDERKADLGML